jgi:predicted negative regulator of RcsB-dependent stress response
MKEQILKVVAWVAVLAGLFFGWTMYQSNQTQVLHQKALKQLLTP